MIELSYIQIYMLMGSVFTIGSYLSEYLTYSYKQITFIRKCSFESVLFLFSVFVLWPVVLVFQVIFTILKSNDVTKRNN